MRWVKLKVVFVPSAGLGGQVTFMGLQYVHVCARAVGRRRAREAMERRECDNLEEGIAVTAELWENERLN